MTKNIKNNVIPFGWKRNLGYIKANFIIMLKRAIEYKTNFYSSLLIEFIYLGSIIIFFGIFTANFNEIIPWSKGDLILYSLLSALIFSISGIFLWKETLFEYASKGTLNSFLTKPIKTWFFYLCFELAPPAIIFIFIDLIFIFIIKFYFNLEFMNLFLSFLILILIVILYLTSYEFLLSFDLIKLGITKNILPSYNRLFQFFENYPILFFKEAPFKLLLIIIFPIIFISSLLLPLLRGYEFMFNPYLQLLILIGLIIVFSLGIWFNWHYGLKKYEAFG